MRASGILLPVASLPGPYGIGTLGRPAHRFVDFLAGAGQKYWQILPIGPTGFGDSPYQTASAFAGSPYLIDLDTLADEGLLARAEIEGADWGGDPSRIDYGKLYENRGAVLRLAFRRGWERDRAAVERFAAEQGDWLVPYAEFMALRGFFGMRARTEWDDARARSHAAPGFDGAMAEYRALLAEDIRYHIYTQLLFFRQWDALRAHARDRGVRLIGDVPIYVPLDSADVWSRPELFRLGADGEPTEVAGVPPDYFTADGQLWGNPLYDWERMERDGFAWWLRRLGWSARLFDAVRIDHFRGLESYWAVPRGEPTARGGRWRRGPGRRFTDAVRAALPELPVIAEDLGFLTPEVETLRRESGWPGMKVLEFAFDPHEPSSYLPHNVGADCVCYTGTHDNPPLGEWAAGLLSEQADYVREYFGLSPQGDLRQALLRGGMRTAAELFVSQLSDWLDGGGRINTPGVLGRGNWCWRAPENALSEALAARMARMCRLYGR